MTKATTSETQPTIKAATEDKNTAKGSSALNPKQAPEATPPADSTSFANAPHSGSELDELRLALEASQTREKTLEETIKRLHAQEDNMHKRSNEALARAKKYAIQPLLESLIPIVESIEKGIETFEQDHDSKAIEQGMQLTHDLLLKTLSQYEVEVIDPLHQPFNPSFHEALGQQPSDEHPKNTILQVLQKGYLLAGRVIRPARVIVCKTN